MSSERRPELDALRTVVVIGLVFFHAALVFDTRDDYYVKNSDTTTVTTVLAGLGVVWAMPLLFTVAGVGAWHSLRKREPGTFAVERLLRLGVPLVFAVLTILPIPPWLRTGPDSSYWAFLPRFYDVRLTPGDFPFLIGGEHFETGHLWFVVLLLVFSLMLALLVRFLPADGWTDRLAGLAARRWMILLPGLPIALICAVVGLEESFAGWSRWAYLLFFLYGFVLATDTRFREALRRHAPVARNLAVAFFVAGAPGFLLTDGDPFTGMGWVQVLCRAAYGLSGWCCMVAILGYLDRPRTGGDPDPRGRRVWGYLAAAALPYYILHQPIVVAVAYGVVPWSAPIIVEYLVIVVISLALTFGVYEFLVRRTRVTRFLFGMRPARVPGGQPVA